MDATSASGGATRLVPQPVAGDASRPLLTTEAVRAATLVIGGDQAPIGSSSTAVDVDHVADCFVKVVVDNVDRFRQLVSERT